MLGLMTTEQTIAVIEAVKKEPTGSGTNYWWLLIIAIVGITPAMIKLLRRKHG